MKRLFRICTVIYIIIIFLFYLGNNIIDTNIFEISSDRIPVSFDGYKIVHISDLHNKNFGKEQFTLLEKIKKQSPNIIVITGDLIYKRSKDTKHSLNFIKGALKIAPVYFVTGNHEAQIEYYPEFSKKLINLGVKILETEGVKLYCGNEYIMLWGVNDPDFYCDSENNLWEDEIMEETLSSISIDKADYNILLSHRPHLLNIYNKFGYDLVFSGHAHGGQVRIPFVGPVVAPDQGIHPKYTSGTYTMGKTTEIVSRGLGGSIVPVRIFNNPELIVCKLKSLKK